jgi:outer membrane protein OmpA-like peptidoglycan-associated protein
MLGALVLAGAGYAQQGPPYSIDIELVRPAFGQGGLSGLDVPISEGGLTTRYGALLMYENAPLTLVEAIDSTELGSVVTHRMALATGVSIDVQRMTFSVMVPSALSWGSELEAFAQDGVGLGDIGTAARLVLVQTPILQAGVRTGLILPTGSREAWLGERGPRLGAGLLASVQLGPLMVASDVGLLARTAVQTNEDFVASDEITWGTGARLALPDATRLAGTFQLLTRTGVGELLAGGAENPAEVLGGVEIYPNRRATLSVELGRGLTEGYGTTDLRVMTGVVMHTGRAYQQGPILQPPPPAPVITRPTLQEEEPEPPVDEVVWRDDEILIPEMVEFVVDTDQIQPYSIDVLEDVAALLNRTAEIAHLVVEGHASQEGDYRHNYELAESRAQKIWEFLLEHGVAEDRVSYRGFGEVKPVASGEDEAALQKNRRVRFVVVRTWPATGPFPDYPDTQVLPWNAAVVPVLQPTEPALPDPVEPVEPVEIEDLDFELELNE